MKHILYTVTGAFICYLIQIPIHAALNLLCPIEHAEHHVACMTLWSTIFFFAVVGLLSGASIKGFHMIGKDFWTWLIPSWAEA